MRDDYNAQHTSTYPRKSTSIFKFTSLTSIPIILLIAITFVLGYISSSISYRTKCPRDHARYDIPECGNPIPPDQVRSTLLNGLYDGVSPYENFPPPGIAPLLQPTRVEGWGSTDVVFSNLVRKVRPRTIIEIGSFLGASATYMGNLTRELGLDTQILCLDDFRGWAGFRGMFKGFPMQNANVMLLAQFMKNVVTLNLADTIIPLPFSSASSLDKLCELGVFGDLIEVDAAHDFHSAWDDINRAYRVLRPGGILFGHDYFNQQDDYGVRRAVDLFAKMHGFTIRTTKEHWILDIYG
ncbi:uncharacterized protein LOC141614134 [Silene latifolia]|uniref:uncharacterized protein LOC141614134 n=1 Tax=Silene latifolia TaxID=37657 RepID=UPI003D7849D1